MATKWFWNVIDHLKPNSSGSGADADGGTFHGNNVTVDTTTVLRSPGTASIKCDMTGNKIEARFTSGSFSNSTSEYCVTFLYRPTGAYGANFLAHDIFRNSLTSNVGLKFNQGKTSGVPVMRVFYEGVQIDSANDYSMTIGNTYRCGLYIKAGTEHTANAAVTTTDTTLDDTRGIGSVANGDIIGCNGKRLTVTSVSGTTITGSGGWSGGSNPGNGNAWREKGTVKTYIDDITSGDIAVGGATLRHSSTNVGMGLVPNAQNGYFGNTPDSGGEDCTHYFQHGACFDTENSGENNPAARVLDPILVVSGSVPIGSGAYSDFSTGTYSNLDEVPPDEATTVVSHSLGSSDPSIFSSYNMSSWSTVGHSSNDTIKAVRYAIRGRSDTSSSIGGTKGFIVEGGTRFIQTGSYLSSASFSYRGNTLYNTPPQSGGSWTTTLYDGCEVGLEANPVGSACTPQITYAALSAVFVAVPETKTHTTDAILVAKVTKTHTADSIPVSRVTKTHTTDAVITAGGPTQVTKTFTTDSILKSTFTKTQTIDSVLKATFVSTQTINGILKATFSASHTTSLIALKTFFLTQNSDSILKGTLTKTQTVDTVRKATFTAPHTTDLITLKTFILTQTSDLILKATFTRSFTSDIILRLTSTIFDTSDAHLVLRLLLTSTTNAILLKVSTLTSTTDSILKGIFTKVHTADSILKATFTKTHTSDLILKSTFSASNTSDLIVLKIVTLTQTSDAILKATFTRSFTSDLILKATFTVTQTTDSTLKLTSTRIQSSDVIIVSRISLSSTSDAILRNVITLTSTTDSILRNTFTKTYTSDAILRATFTIFQTSDAVLRATFTASQTSDSIIKATFTKVNTSDAILRATLTATHTTDLITTASLTKIHTTDAILRITLTVNQTSDAILLAIRTLIQTSDMILKGTLTRSQTVDSILLKISALLQTGDLRIVHVGRAVWVSPTHGSSGNSTPLLVFKMPAGSGNMHFTIEIDSVNTFNSGDLIRVRSSASQTNWEYFNGSVWAAFPSSGIPQTYAGNQARYQATLGSGTWYRRVRAERI